MARRPSESRYKRSGKVTYLVYQSPQVTRGGATHERTRVKRLYFPGDAAEIQMSAPKTLSKRTGRRVHGVAVTYRHKLAATTARRGKTASRTPERWSERTRIVELPAKAHDPRLTDRPPKGARFAVA